MTWSRVGDVTDAAGDDPNAPTMVHLSDPSLIVLIGAAGSGKSTFAARQFEAGEILSSDAYRAAIAGDPGDQTVNGAVFKALHAALDRRLRAGRLSVVDATNLTGSARRAVVSRAQRAGIPSVAFVFDLPAEIVLARNAARHDRVVPEAVVRRHLAEVRALVDGSALTSAGFRSIVTMTSPDAVDGIQIHRAGVGTAER